MSNARLGRLNVQIIIQDGYRIHYGPEDTVKGTIVISYKPYTSLLKANIATADLFGPIQIHGILRSRVWIKVRKGDSHRLPSDHSKTLFDCPFEVFIGSFKASAGDELSYPFAINLPQDLKDIYAPANEGSYPELMSNGNTRDKMLPLTMDMVFKDHPDIITFNVTHRIGASVTMPGIDIKTDIPEGDSCPEIQLDLPRPPRSLIDQNNKTTFSQPARVQNEYLLPENERPQTFKQKAKAVFTSAHFPEFVMDVQCTHPEYIHPGQRLTFEIVLRRNDKESADVPFPEVSLEVFSCDLRAYTIVDVSERIVGSPQCIDRRTVQSLIPSLGHGHTKLSSQAPITKEKDHSITRSTDPVIQQVSSFAHQKVSRQYLLRIEMRFRLAGESVKVKKECPVILVPAPKGWEGDGAMGAVAGSSSLQSYIRPPPDDDGDLPAYGEAGSSMLLHAGAPPTDEYEYGAAPSSRS